MQFKNNTKQRNVSIQGLRSFKDTLPKNVKRIINKKGHIYSETLSNWKYLVGDELFKCCYPKTFKSSNKFGVSTLVIMVKRGHEVDIEYSKKDILNKMNAYFGYEVVEKLKFISFDDEQKVLPGSSQPQDLGTISYKDTETNETSQQIQSVDTTASIVTETFQSEEKILPQDLNPVEQYEFATSFLKVGDYSTAERAFREFVLSNADHELAGSAQYWYAETFRIRQLYTDAASAYLEGYQKYPKGKKAPINLLKLGVSMVQIGEKDQGCKMINGVELQYPNANQSVIQKAKYESKKFECIKQDS